MPADDQRWPVLPAGCAAVERCCWCSCVASTHQQQQLLPVVKANILNHSRCKFSCRWQPGSLRYWLVVLSTLPLMLLTRDDSKLSHLIFCFFLNCCAGGYLVPCGTLRYWLVVLSPLPLMLLVWGVIRQHVLWKADVKRCLGLKQAGDLKWNRR